MSGQPGTVPNEINDYQAIRKYAHLSGRVLTCIDRMMVLEHTRTHAYEDVRDKIRTNTFNLVVVGQFKRGKTMLINALLGADILPVAVVPLTSIATVLTFGETLRTRVLFNDGRITEIDPEQLAEYVTETENPKNKKEVREVTVTYPSTYLEDGVRLIDTPGVGSVYMHNTDVAYQYLPKSDAALFLLSVEQPVSQAELDFLRDVSHYADRIFFLLNKIDYFSDHEIEESIAFSKRILSEVMGSDLRIFPVSAKLALEGKMKGSNELLKSSKLPAFSEVLDKFLMHEKGKVLLLSVTNGLLRILAQARLESELELKSLTTPLDELETKMEAFGRKKSEILSEKQNFGILLEGEVERLVRAVLDADLAAFREEFIPRMEEDFDAFYREKRDLPLKELDEALEAYVASQIERAFNGWRAAEDERLAAAFEAICGRFREKINERVDELLQFSSQLFAIPFETTGSEKLWVARASFYYKLKEEPVGLDMLATSLTQVLPGLVSSRFQKIRAYLFRVAHRRIFKKRKEHMLQTIDMQAGRMRFDFMDRLNKGTMGFRQEMLQKIEATVQGIALAMEQGMNQRSRGERRWRGDCRHSRRS